MKIGVSSYSFQKLYSPGFTYFDAISHAKKTGFDCIEFIDFNIPEGEGIIDFAAKVKDACDAAGLEISAYTVWADFINSFAGDIDKETERLKGCVDIAAALGAGKLRHDVTWGFKTRERGRSYKDAIRIATPAIREVADYAETKDIQTMTENHGYFMQDSRRMEELVLAVDHPNYGLLVDIGNFACADEDSIAAVSCVAPYAFHVHVKDFLWKPSSGVRPDSEWFATRGGNYLRGTVAGHGIIPVAQCLAILTSAGYSDTVSLEFEGTEEPLKAIERGFEAIKRSINSTI